MTSNLNAKDIDFAQQQIGAAARHILDRNAALQWKSHWAKDSMGDYTICRITDFAGNRLIEIKVER